MDHPSSESAARAAQDDRTLLGIGLMVVFCVVAPLIDVSSKIAVQSVSTGTVTLFRFVVQAALMAPVVLLLRLPVRRSRTVLALTLARALVNIASTFTFVAAVRVMPIADALAVAFVSPFILLVMGRFILGETIGARRLGAAVVGFSGTLLIIQPSFAAFGWVALLPVGCAFFFAVYMLITRRLARDLHPVAMQFDTAVAASLLCLPLLGLGTAAGWPSAGFSMPEGAIWFWCVGVGLMATISHMAMTYALSFAPSSTLAPLNYLEIVTATLFGFLFFGDFPGGMTWAGIGIVILSGLYVIHRERIAARDRRMALPLAGLDPV
ncbi:DMT family transporter [Aurantimonas sp. Leaf443]|uniref:DMT family transporter n=1 Tax=Aurantimonas sp. Leaf443 TaxID=1736378 RepID=UPI0006F3DA00|nr:DMT family transporter [Aurantimonas sp. Leaf443]KQT85437.1 hypothetical protein ASG48_09390 [Aurantimonas sp. Leaf443]